MFCPQKHMFSGDLFVVTVHSVDVNVFFLFGRRRGQNLQMRQGGHFAFLFVFANSFQLHREVCNLCEVCNLAYWISYRKCIISSFDNPLTNYTLIYTAKAVFFINTTATSLLIPIDKIGLPVRRSRQFRRVNEAFVKTLIQELLKEPCGSHGCLFVVVKDISTREDFDIQKKDDYEYEVLGGTDTWHWQPNSYILSTQIISIFVAEWQRSTVVLQTSKRSILVPCIRSHHHTAMMWHIERR